jgi:uncharacterized OB-fold protein
MNGAPADRVPMPRRIFTALTQTYWSAAERGILLLQACEACNRVQLYPGGLCRSCWSQSLNWREATVLGTVWSFTVAERPGHPAWQSLTPYCIAIVELDEGPRLLTNIVGGDPYEVYIGQRVRLIDAPPDREAPPLRFRTC